MKTNEEIQEIQNLMKLRHLKWIDGIYNNRESKLVCINNEGYKVITTKSRLLVNKIPRIVSKSNIYSIENINKFIKFNNLSFQLLSDSYIDSSEKLELKCFNCESLIFKSWDEIKSKKNCRKCSYLKRANNFSFDIDFIKNENLNKNKNIVILSSVYINAQTELNFKCKKCSYEWKRTWASHKINYNCPSCKNTLNYTGGYRSDVKNSRNKEKIVTFYIIECFNDTEKFYKVGITLNSLKKRFSSFPYNYNIKLQYKTNVVKARSMEKMIIETEKQYIPKIKFDGYTECLIEFNNLDEIEKMLGGNL